MSRRNQDLVSRVRFEVDSRMANASMQALQAHAEKLNQQVAEVNASIKALGDVPDDNPALLEYRKQLRRLNSDLKDVNTTMKDYTRGVKAAGELYRHYAMGNIEDMSIKAIRAGVNGMKKRLDNLKAGGDPGDAEEMRLIEAITNEADVVVKRFKTDYQHVVEEIARGGTVTEQTLKRTRDGLADLMQTAETEAEKNELTNYWQKVGAAIEAVAVENRRLRGEVADREEAMRIAYATDHDGSQQAIHDAEARADAARRENDELRQRLDLKQQQRRELEQEMDINSMQVRSLMDRRDELKAQEKEDRAIRNQRVDDANKELNAARRAAKTQQQAYDEQKQTVEKLRTEVQGLTDDIRKMGEVKAEPKIDTSDIEGLKKKIESTIDELGTLEQQWDDKIADYIFEKYPTQATVSAKTKSPEGLKEREAMKKDTVLAQMQKQREQELNAVDERLTSLIRKEREWTEAQQQSSTAQQQSAQSSEQLAQKQEKLSQKTAELNQQQDKLNGMVDETVTANQRLARAEQEQTDARNAQAEAKKHEGEAVKKVEDELRGLTDEQLKNAQAYSHLTEEINADTAAMQRNITTEQEATREADRLRSGSIDKMEQALARLRESNRKLDPTIDKEEWERGERAIGQLTLRLEELKKQSAELRREPVLDMMTQRMQSLGTLSRDALTETKKFWEQMVDGAQKGSTELADYEQHLKSIALEEQARVREQGREAFDFFQREDYRRTNAADTEEQRKALVAYRDALPADATDHIEAINALLEKQAQFVKEAAGEWMSLEKAMELASKAGTDQFAGSAKDIQLATQSLERQRDTIIATIREKRSLGQATKAEEDQLADLTKKLRSLKFEQDNVNMSQEKMRTLIETPANAVNLDELRAAIKRADGQLRQMEQSLGQNSDEYKRFAEQVRQAKNVMKEMEGQAKASATAWEKAVSRIKTYVVLYMGFNELWQKITGTMGDMLELSDKMGEVMKTTQFSADQVARLSDNLKELDTRTPMVKLMELSAIAGSIGLKTQEQVEGFTDAANQLMVALPEMGSEAARTLMKIADATGDLEKNEGDVRETLERVGSTIIALRANSAAAAGPITDFVSRVGAVGAQAGISIDQIAALGATVDALGGRVEMSATALSRMIPAIRNNSFAVANAIGMAEQDLKKMTAMEQMVAIFKALRDSVKQFDTSTDEGMNAMADKVEQMLGNSASMQEVMKTLNQQGARAGIVFGLLSQNVDKLEEQLTTATDAYRDNTALMEEYNKMNDTAAARWERLKNQLEEFFVTAGNTSWLSETIDLLRKLIVLITAEGPIGSFFRWTLVYLGLIQAKWSQAIGGAILSVYQFAAASLKSATATAADTAAKTANAAAANAQATATGKAAAAQGLLNKTMKANIITAVVTAVVALGFRLWEYFRAANSAQEAQKRLNEAVSQATVEAEREVGHLNNVIKALDNAKMSAEGRKEVIDKFNRDYSKYIDALGIEIKTVQDLKDNYDLLTSAIRRAAFERVRDQFKAQELEPLIKEAVEQGADLQTGANSTLNAIVLNDAQKSVSQFTKAVADLTEKNLKDFRSTYRKQLQNLGLDADKATLSQIQAAATPQASNRLMNQAIQQGPQSLNEYLIGKMDRGEIKDAAEAYKDIIKKEFSKGELFNAVFDENLNYVIGQRVVNGRTVGTPLTEQTGAPGGEKSSAFNEKLYEQIEKFVTAYMEVKNRNDQIDAAFRPYVGSEDIASGNGGGGSNGGGGGGGTNPYGQYDRVTDPYSKWNGDDLVARRKEMLVRVRALANGADVQKVLSEDAKFISEAVRKNIKTTEQAIEWYNAERLKIQEALYNKHLTPTGDWLDPKKGAGNWRKQLQTDFDNYLRILDAYYTERKAHIEKAQAEEGLSEAEAQRLTVENETVWRKHRMELQQIYLGKSADIAEEERQRIYNILAEQDEDSADMVEKQIAISINKLHLLAQKSEVEARKIETKLVKDIATDHYKQQNAVSKQMEAIEKIISEERPFDGITKNLRDNLSTMGVLFADFDKKRREAIERGEQPEDDMAERAKQMAKRLSVVLDGVPDAYRMTFDQLKDVMIKEGFGEWAKAIESDEQLKLAMMAQIRKTYDQVQEAIRKEASIIKKHADNLWNDALTPDGKSMKNQFEAAISQLGLQADQVKRANSLIGAGVASDRVADRLVIQQMKVQLAMERARFALMHKIGEERIRQEQAVEESLRRQGKLEEAKRKHADIENMQKSLGLAISEEQKKVDEQRVAIQNQLEESQNRLYTELRSWADLLTSSLQGVMEASHAGDAEYYNERAKLNLTGKGGPGAGTYVVIDDAGTSDATAHYEYLDERQALERQHEIEVQNAQAEAWKKLWDDLNMKMSEQITDWLNAAAQNASTDANTAALGTLTTAENANTNAMQSLSQQMVQLAEAVRENTAAGDGSSSDGGTNDTGETLSESGVSPAAQQKINDQNAVTQNKLENDKKEEESEKNKDKKMATSSQSTFAKITQAANMYGIAYQAMSNDNLSATQKFEMMAVQAAGQAAIAMLTTDLAAGQGKTAAQMPGILGQCIEAAGPYAGPVLFAVISGVLGGLLGLAVSKIAKGKSEIAQVTGTSASAGRLSTGMMTYAEGNVNELTDPASLTPGRQYNVDGADGKTYRARYMGKGAKTHITNGPEFHLVGEAGREAIIDAKTTRLLQMNETGIWRDIQTLYNGGSISGLSSRRRRGGVAAFADGNVGEFEDALGGEAPSTGAGGMGMEKMLTALDRNSAIQEALLERLKHPIYARNIWTGPEGIPNMYNKMQKVAQRHGEKYL